MAEENPPTPPTASSSDTKAPPPPQDPSESEQSSPDENNDASATISIPPPPGSSASLQDSVAESTDTATPTLGGSTTTQVNVVNRGFTPRPSTSSDKPNTQHQFYANIPTAKTHRGDDNESLVSRSTAQRTNFSSSQVGGGHRRPPSRSHVPAIMPAYSFYHPLRPPAIAQASGQQQMPQTEEIVIPQKEVPGQGDEISSVHGKPSTEPLLPKKVALVKQEVPPRVLHPVVETASNRTSMYSTHLLRTSTAPGIPPASVPQQKNNGVLHVPVQNMNQETRNWQHFPGKTKYHLNGRVQFGTQYFANIGTGALIVIPSALYFAFTYLLLQIPANQIVVGICGPNILLHYQ